MSDNKINIEITANADGIKSGAKEAQDSISKISDSVNQLSDDSQKSTGFISKLHNSITNVKEAVSSDTGKGIFSNLIVAVPVLISELKELSGAGLGVFSTLGSAAKNTGFEIFGLIKEVSNLKADLKTSAVRAGLTGLATTAAVEFEASFANVKKVLNGTDEEMQSVEKTIKRLATEIPLTTDELNAIAAAGAQMGLSAGEIEPFIKAVAEAAASFEMLPDEAGKAFGALKNIYAIGTKDLSSLSDQINFVADRSSGSVSERDIINILVRSGEAAKAFGLLRGETVSLAAAMLNLGKPPEIAGTAINNLLQSLQTASQKPKEFNDALQALGLTADGLSQSISENAGSALDDFLSRLEKLDQASRSNVLAAMFGGGSDTQSIASLVSSLNEYHRLVKMAGDSALYAGSAHKTFTEQAKTTSSTLTILWSSVKNLANEMTAPLLPLINTVSNGFSGLLNVLSNAAVENPVVVMFARLTFVILPLAGLLNLIRYAFVYLAPVIVSYIAPAIGTLVSRLTSLFIITTPGIGLIGRLSMVFSGLGRVLLWMVGGPIGAVLIAVTGLFAVWEKYKDQLISVQGITTSVSNAVSAAWQVVLNTLKNSFSMFFSDVKSGLDKTGSKASDTASKFKLDWGGVGYAIKETLYESFNAIIRAFDITIGTLSTGIAAFITQTKAEVEELKNLDFSGSQSGQISVTGAMSDYISQAIKRDYLGEFMGATAEQLKTEQDKPATTATAETKPQDNGLSVSLPGKEDSSQLTKAKALIKEKLDADLAAIKTKQEALKETADLEQKQLEANLKKQELALKEQVEPGQLTQIQADEQLLNLKKQLADKKLAIEKDLILKSAGLDNSALDARIKAVKSETSIASASVVNLDNELAKAAKKYGFNLDAVQAKFTEASQKYGISENLLKAQAFSESRFNPDARSPVGAVGFSQFMPGTAERFGLKNPNDPIASIEAQAKYMSQLTAIFGDATKALAGYNWGEGKKGSEHRAKIQSGDLNALPKETSGYVKKITGIAGGESAEAVQEKNAKLAALNAERLANEQATNAKLKALGIDEQNNVTEQSTAELAVLKEKNAKQKALDEEQLSADHAAALDALALKEAAAQQELDLGNISNEEHLAKLRTFAAERLSIEQALLEEKRKLLDNDALALAKNLHDKEALERNYNATLRNLDNQEAMAKQEGFKKAFAPLENALNQSVNGILTNQQTVKNAVKNTTQSVVVSYAESFIKTRIMSMAQWAWEVSGLAGVEAQKKAIKSFAFLFDSQISAKEKVQKAADWVWETLGFSKKEATKKSISNAGFVSDSLLAAKEKLLLTAQWAWETAGFTKKEAKEKTIKQAGILFDRLTRAKEKAALAIDWASEATGFTTKEATKTAAKVGAESAQTAAQVTGDITRTVSAESASAATKAAHGSSAKSSIMESAASAAGNVYDSVSQIPYVGWILAPIAAAATFVAVAGYTAYVGSAKGGEWEVGEDGSRYILHARESVIPAPIAEPMRQFFNLGAAGKLIKSLADPADNTNTTALSVVDQLKSHGKLGQLILPQYATNMSSQSQATANAFARERMQSDNAKAATTTSKTTNFTVNGMTPEQFFGQNSHLIVKAAGKEARNFNTGRKP